MEGGIEPGWTEFLAGRELACSSRACKAGSREGVGPQISQITQIGRNDRTGTGFERRNSGSSALSARSAGNFSCCPLLRSPQLNQGSTTSNERTCRNSRLLNVATAHRRCAAVAATIRSWGPIICPALVSCAQILAWVRASRPSNGTISSRRTTFSIQRLRRRARAGSASTSIPNQSSLKVMALIATGSGGLAWSHAGKSKPLRSSAISSEVSRISPTGS